MYFLMKKFPPHLVHLYLPPSLPNPTVPANPPSLQPSTNPVKRLDWHFPTGNSEKGLVPRCKKRAMCSAAPPASETAPIPLVLFIIVLKSFDVLKTLCDKPLSENHRLAGAETGLLRTYRQPDLTRTGSPCSLRLFSLDLTPSLSKEKHYDYSKRGSGNVRDFCQVVPASAKFISFKQARSDLNSVVSRFATRDQVHRQAI
ncbi:hypothetical protein B0H12DRAFT_1221315 [Mycena haematopus]|nr:hypothetical protein B0H12DRAFT_1221315 [Mycena haematopus]